MSTRRLFHIGSSLLLVDHRHGFVHRIQLVAHAARLQFGKLRIERLARHAHERHLNVLRHLLARERLLRDPERRRHRARRIRHRGRFIARTRLVLPPVEFVVTIAEHDDRRRAARGLECLRGAETIVALGRHAVDLRQRRQHARHGLLCDRLRPVAVDARDDLHARILLQFVDDALVNRFVDRHARQATHFEQRALAVQTLREIVDLIRAPRMEVERHAIRARLGHDAVVRDHDDARRAGLLDDAVERRGRGRIDDDRAIALQDQVLDLLRLLRHLVFGRRERGRRRDALLRDRFVRHRLPVLDHGLPPRVARVVVRQRDLLRRGAGLRDLRVRARRREREAHQRDRAGNVAQFTHRISSPLKGSCLAGCSDVDSARAAHANRQRIDRGRRRDEQTVAIEAAEREIRDRFGNQDLAEQRAVRRIAVHAIGGAGPDVAVFVDAQAVRNALLHRHENAAVHEPSVAHVECANMARTVLDMRRARVGDIERRFVGRERETVRLDEVVGDAARFRRAAHERIHVAAADLALGAKAFVVAENAVVGIGEPDRALRIDHEIVRRIQALAVVMRGQHGYAAVVFGARNTAPSVFAAHEPPFAVARVAVAEIRVRAEHAHAHAGRPAHHAVVRNVAPDEHIARGKIHRPFGPQAVARDLLQQRVRLDQPPKTRIVDFVVVRVHGVSLLFDEDGGRKRSGAGASLRRAHPVYSGILMSNQESSGVVSAASARPRPP
ncbi:hypothetical protein PT2222_70130 [Paraburkholderia tropica]